MTLTECYHALDEMFPGRDYMSVRRISVARSRDGFSASCRDLFSDMSDIETKNNYETPEAALSALISKARKLKALEIDE